MIKGYATLRDAKLSESSYDKVVMRTGGSYDYDDVVRALVRLDRPEMRPGTSGPKRQDHTDVFFWTRNLIHRQSSQVPRFGHNRVWTDHTGTRFSTHCKRTSTSARTERRQAHVMERSPSREFSIIPTRAWGKLKRMRYRRYYCMLDQLSNILDTGPSERISMLRRNPEVSSAPEEVQVAELRDRA